MFAACYVLIILLGLFDSIRGEPPEPHLEMIEKRIHRGIILDPTMFYNWYGWGDAKGYEAWRNEIWPDSSLFYPQVQALGVDFTIAGHHWEMFNSPVVPDHNECLGGLHILVVAGEAQDLATTSRYKNFSIQNALTTINVEDDFWRTSAADWKWGAESESDYFQFTVNPTGLVCESVYDETGEIECYRSQTIKHNPGYIFKDQAIHPQVNNYPYAYTFQLEVRLDEDQRKLPYDTGILRFSVDDPRLVKKGSPDSYTIKADDFNESGVWQWFTFRTDEFLAARGKTKLSLLWYGKANISVRNLRMFDCYWDHLFNEEDPSWPEEQDFHVDNSWSVKPKDFYWNAVQFEFNRLEDYFQPTGRLWGFLVDEPRRIAWEGFARMRKNIQLWRRNPEIELHAVSAGLSEEALPVYLEKTQVPLLIYDFYVLGFQIDYASKGKNSLQTAWNSLICNPSRKADDVNYRGGLRAAARAAKARGIDWWFMLQAYGSLTQKDEGWVQNTRNPTREEILCQGWLGLAYGAKGFVYYHYAPCYYYGYREPANESLPAWNGAVSRGLTDLWPDAAHPSDSLIENEDEFKQAVQTRGWLHPNYKWFAVQEFNRSLDQMEDFVPDLDWLSAGCTADSGGEIGGLEITEVKGLRGKADSGQEMFVEAGVFNLTGYDRVYCLVNRRCEPQETRTLRGVVQTSGCSFVDLRTGSELKAEPGVKGCSSFYITLPPGEGAFIGVR